VAQHELFTDYITHAIRMTGTPDRTEATQPDVKGPAADIEAALKALREAKDKDGQKKAAEALEAALKQLKEQVK
jgi:hypothetical protein